MTRRQYCKGKRYPPVLCAAKSTDSLHSAVCRHFCNGRTYYLRRLVANMRVPQGSVPGWRDAGQRFELPSPQKLELQTQLSSSKSEPLHKSCLKRSMTKPEEDTPGTSSESDDDFFATVKDFAEVGGSGSSPSRYCNASIMFSVHQHAW